MRWIVCAMGTQNVAKPGSESAEYPPAPSWVGCLPGSVMATLRRVVEKCGLGGCAAWVLRPGGHVRHVLELGAPCIALCPVDESPWHRHVDRLEAAFQALGEWGVSEARAGRHVPLEITHMLLRQLHATRGPGAYVHAMRHGRSRTESIPGDTIQ